MEAGSHISVAPASVGQAGQDQGCQVDGCAERRQGCGDGQKKAGPARAVHQMLRGQYLQGGERDGERHEIGHRPVRDGLAKVDSGHLQDDGHHTGHHGAGYPAGCREPDSLRYVSWPNVSGLAKAQLLIAQ